MFFREYFDRRAIRKKCFREIKKHTDEIRVLLLSKPIMYDSHQYVARMGLFTEDMMDINIPYVTWFCRRDGQINPSWRYSLYRPGQEYERYKHLIEEPFVSSIPISMTLKESNYIKELSLETWTMAKLDGSLDDIDKIRYTMRYAGGGIDVVV